MKKPRLTLPTIDPAQAFIQEGGSVPSEKANSPASEVSEENFKAFSLRLLPSMLKELQDIRDNRPRIQPQSIHTFIVQAIAVAIEKEKRKNNKKD